MVDPSNLAQLHEWDGGRGGHWARQADRFDQALAAHNKRLIDATESCGSGPALDIGCGAGRTTQDLAVKHSKVLGVDLSGEMLRVARMRTRKAGVHRASFLQADAQIHPFEPRSFDLAVSRYGTLFFGDPLAGFRNIATALRPGAKLAVLSWQPFEFNEWMSTLHSIFSGGSPLPESRDGPGELHHPVQTRRLLWESDFDEVTCEELRENVFFGHNVEEAEVFAIGQFRSLLRNLGLDDRKKVAIELRENIREHESEVGINYGSASWLITATKR